MKVDNFLKVIIVGLVLVVTSIIIVSCEAPDDDSVCVDNGYVTRYIDDEAGIVCYWMYAGIDCIPIEQTRLDK